MSFLTDVLSSGVRLGAPIATASLGETYSERSGVINVGLEGMMLVGAFSAVLGSTEFGSAWIGLLMGIAAGLLLAAIHAFVCITLRGDQIVSGIAINLLALGVTSFLFGVILKDRQERAAGFEAVKIPGLSDIPIVGPALFDQSALVYLLYVLTIVSVTILYRSTWGLKVQAAGENPAAADAAGVNVNRIRYQCVCFAGSCAGMGGALLALSGLGFFVDNMTAGRGFIALAAVIFGNWRPGLVVLAAGFFGVIDALQLRLQAGGIPVPSEAMTMLPYVLTLVALAGVMGRARMPAYLTRVYVRGEE